MAKKLTTEEFIERAKEVHGNKYDYSKVEYEKWDKKVCIICPECGEMFWQTPNNHIHKTHPQGCYNCVKIKLKTEDFKQRAREVHGDRYDYSKVKYVNRRTNVIIICPKHGEFEQNPYSHLSGRGCRKCHDDAKRLSVEEFIERSRKVHRNKYDYSKVDYVNNVTPVTIICPKHGEFTQKPTSHLSGSGCPNCNSSRLEIDFADFLLSNGFTESKDDNGISSKDVFIRQKKFDWLKYCGKLFLDFYLPDHNIAIECQGIQHFEPVDIFGGEEKFIATQERDYIKRQLCEEYGIKIFYYSNLGIEYPYKVYEDPDEILKEIRSLE